MVASVGYFLRISFDPVVFCYSYIVVHIGILRKQGSWSVYRISEIHKYFLKFAYLLFIISSLQFLFCFKFSYIHIITVMFLKCPSILLTISSSQQHVRQVRTRIFRDQEMCLPASRVLTPTCWVPQARPHFSSAIANAATVRSGWSVPVSHLVFPIQPRKWW